MKILLVKSFYNLSSVGCLAAQLKRQGHDVHVLVPARHVSSEKLERLGIPVHILDFSNPAPWSIRGFIKHLQILKDLRRLLAANDFDIVHLNLASGRLYGRIASLFTSRTRVASSIRGLEFLFEWWTNWIDAATIAVSRPVRDFLVCNGIPPEKIHVIYNGIDLQELDAVKVDRHYLHCELGLDKNVPLVGMVAYFRNDFDKGHRIFLDACRLMAQRQPQLRFIIAGGDIPGTVCGSKCFEKYAEAIGVGRKVYFLGERSDIPALLSSLNVFVLPSLGEKDGCPMALLEAMTRSVPVVASRIPVVADILEPERSGIFFEPGNSEQLARCVESLLENPEESAGLVGRGRQKVATCFTAEIMGKAYEQVFQEVRTSSHKFSAVAAKWSRWSAHLTGSRQRTGRDPRLPGGP